MGLRHLEVAPKLAERLKKIKEEPLIDERIPHPYREVVKELKAIKAQLEEIKQKLPIPIPPPPPVRPGVPPVIKIPAIQLPKEDFMNIYVEALKKHGALKFADDLHVETIDLSVDRSTAAKIQEFPKLKGIALNLYKNTGTADIYLNMKDDYHKLTVEEVEPPGFLLDWFKVKTVYVGNEAQTGKQLIIVAWKVTA